ncbi:5-oxoprolinase subunit B family protein [Sulfitobacter donghicola]|uniref:Allophanate hydrolase n=1 Tax=Sulfitobacter donghicola DSW-25 = KCTC 12864 = JCM 14565 TaxID=1300350 RepID=A0A073IKC2_9RHOB|nr:carboxyltransferase domain-containing protein [Sulfitobacter donghicola]KEJ90778.1 allophanate hydrolase [Sulfitobacter donghicola DSW-25 = KCTC 12864 = JCM 14565]KIN68037.1 Allophanate hydrolase family protein [Sulfitobacter donghicola DSW-25 = KCTC 12864 = JCM 14565]
MTADYPRIRRVGLAGLLVQFGEGMSEPANRAAIAFRAAVEAQHWPEVWETSTSLVSTFVSADLISSAPNALSEKLQGLLEQSDWYAAPLPAGRTLWEIPTLYGTDAAPQLEEAATAAGVTPEQAIHELSSARVRVLTIGFAPGQPYTGELPPHWDIPRQQTLTRSVPSGALVVAIRQLIVFTNASPTGWRHIGQTAFRTFRPTGVEPIALTPGDELSFPSVSQAEYEKICKSDQSGDGGAQRSALP